MKKYVEKLVIFDCDGVLVDSESLALEAMSKCLSDLGFSKTPEEFNSATYRGANLATVLAELEGEFSMKLPSDFEERYRFEMNHRFTTGLKPIPGIKEALKEIRCKMCVASGGPLAKIKRSFELTGLTDWFGENIFSSYSIQSWKPEPNLFLHAANTMKVPPEDCLVVEDAVFGVQAAIRANMRVLAYHVGQDVSQFANLGATLFSDMRVLPDLVPVVFSPRV